MYIGTGNYSLLSSIYHGMKRLQPTSCSIFFTSPHALQTLILTLSLTFTFICISRNGLAALAHSGINLFERFLILRSSPHTHLLSIRLSVRSSVIQHDSFTGNQ